MIEHVWDIMEIYKNAEILIFQKKIFSTLGMKRKLLVAVKNMLLSIWIEIGCHY